MTRVCVGAGTPFRNLNDLTNTNERYPELIPLLIDWLRNVESYTGLQDDRDISRFRDILSRALTTPDAVGTDAAAVLLDQFELDPPMREVNLDGVANALLYVARPEDYERMAEIAADRRFGYGRTQILAWLIKQKREDGLRLVVEQLDDPSVRALGIKFIRMFKPFGSSPHHRAVSRRPRQ